MMILVRVDEASRKYVRVSENWVLEVSLLPVTEDVVLTEDAWLVDEMNVPSAVDTVLVVVTVERVLEDVSVVDPTGLKSKRPILCPPLSVK